MNLNEKPKLKQVFATKTTRVLYGAAVSFIGPPAVSTCGCFDCLNGKMMCAEDMHVLDNYQTDNFIHLRYLLILLQKMTGCNSSTLYCPSQAFVQKASQTWCNGAWLRCSAVHHHPVAPLCATTYHTCLVCLSNL
jgi:Pyruvate/2-oxoacid:ferredoxin oxidoreductase delta subunit